MDVSFDAALRLFGAVVVGTMVGLQRHLHHRPAGVRTHALVALAAAVVTLGCSRALPGQSNLAPAVQGVVTGVGFLGAGVILRPSREAEVVGLTTAASVWLVAAFGAVLGLGQWAVVVPGFVLTGLVLAGGGILEEAVARRVLPPSARRPASGSEDNQHSQSARGP
jgi:putative Mg2+ transporter-C (MgtC) family protein